VEVNGEGWSGERGRETTVTTGPQNFLAVIKVLGVGGCGSKTVNRLIEAGVRGVEFVAINTDVQDLISCDADIKLDIGREVTRGLGAGSDPEVGREAAEASREEIEEIVAGADMVFITAGEGGGTGTGAAPVVAEIARAAGALTVAVVTRPFDFEGRQKSLRAENGINRLRDKVDTLIIVPNQRLLAIAKEDTSLEEALRKANELLLQGVSGITDLITTPGLINTDFADVRTILRNAGSALIGIGVGTGDNRAVVAANAAINSPLFDYSIEGARGILLNVTGPSDMGLHEVNAAAEIVHQVAHADANIIFGTSIDDELDDQIRVTVIAAGFNRNEPRPRAGSTGTTGTSRGTEGRGSRLKEIFGTDDIGDDDGPDVPEFLK
jgi:cell division protein FtsZ